MEVPVDIWTMDSDPGYKPSSGYGEVRLLGVGDVAWKYEDGEEALFDLATSSDAFRAIRPDEVLSPRKYSYKNGVCNYRGVKGTFYVPPGSVAVQVEYYDICTNNGPSCHAEILNRESLRQEYLRMAEMYTRMAG